MMVHSHPTKTLKENHLQNSINLAAQSQTPKELVDEKARNNAQTLQSQCKPTGRLI